LTRSTLFLDLRAGFVYGTDPTQVDTANRELGGVSTEAAMTGRIGHFGGSISYRRIWNLMRSDADIDQLTVYGTIDF
jgi:hypothetical protein